MSLVYTPRNRPCVHCGFWSYRLRESDADCPFRPGKRRRNLIEWIKRVLDRLAG
jgi:hypothetical protein